MFRHVPECSMFRVLSTPHPNSKSLRTLIFNPFIEGHPIFLQNIFLWCWNDLLPFFIAIILLNSFCKVFWVSSFYLSVNIVVLYQFTVTCIES